MTDEHPTSLVEDIARLVGWHDTARPKKPWSDVERELGTRLPSDYKALLTRLPGGVFRNINIHSPAASEQAWNDFKNNLDQELQILGDEDLEYLAKVNYRVFPEPGGLLPWGSDGQGGTFCWITEPADPDTWRITYYSQGSDEWREHPGPVTRLLYEILTNTGEDNILGWDFTELPVEFIPSSTHH
ncbi:SMI1/KNR4 family protein [Amycolatopsis alba]|uniref:SMI1/KNR4 family protein n=1 Tax=Amycolatopsis alba DSM 44262 TaxID=1125972 RepID=A0A229RDV1_AMYAL|nr:SMI1/KNR4 family protein [Amycolatopsis alba]OXM44817.1 hypothetical protein CFP75_33390 [Amycolatopsis alba DSM 44262]